VRSQATVVAALAVVLVAFESSAQDADESTSFAFRTALKSSFLVTGPAGDPGQLNDTTSVQGLGRVRFEPTVRFGDSVTVGGAYEVRLRVFSADAGLSGIGILPREAPAPFRVEQLDWNILATSGATAWNEIDRAFVGWHQPRAEITVGRQAIGWGRGAMFGAVDLFSPFSPLEADREWRRGVDALRADLKLTPRTSLDVVGAFGPTIDDSAFGGRLRGYAGRADVEVVGGRRAQDWFGGATTSAAIKDAEVHAEVAIFRTQDPSDSGVLHNTVAKAVVGASYLLPIGPGILTFAEYHYSGFGVTDPSEIIPALTDPAFLKRYLRGDTQILERHAIGILSSAEWSPELTVAGQWIHSPVDGSGVVAPSFTWSFGDKASVLVNVYFPYGAAPVGTTLRSLYGATGRSGLIQIRLYS
jgi:hypothetical protein